MSAKQAQAGLFETADHLPLPERLRPNHFSQVVGQEALVGEGGVLTRMVQSGHYRSLIFWGPPGCGKTTLARLLAEASGYEMETLSAVSSGVADLKKVFERARERLADGLRTLLFVDEIHRFNRAQQDAFLPVMEDGTLILIGATTENPSFELNAALLSRAQVLILERLNESNMQQMLQQVVQHLGTALPLTDDAIHALMQMADGDGRYLLGLLDIVLNAAPKAPLDVAALSALVQKRAPVYDKHQDSHYNLISALHKSLRGSDVDAALYWFHRMLAGGESAHYVLRRLVRFAVEDIGMADPQALVQVNAAKEAYDFLGSPEGDLAIAQAVIYLATAPKSNAQYLAHKAAAASAMANGSLMPPAHILNAPTTLMKEAGYGAGYAYDHDAPDGFSGQNYFPDTMRRQVYYQPVERGFEREIIKRLDYWNKKRSTRG